FLGKATLRPPESVKTQIQKCLKTLETLEPAQYYYPNSDIHITVMSIISCYNDFDLSKIDISRYVDIIKKCLVHSQDISIQFKGLTASNSCIMLQGFMDNSALNDLRDELRSAFKTSDLEQSLDKRYAIQTAHSTVVRFKNKIQNPEALIKVIETYANHDFGSFKVQNFELVYNDWYQRKKFVKVLHEFKV
uniref:2'-5' RNA ligase family protein n=1 Tax=Pseudotamlana agarivorans TaxID=481183 RepID=UPI000836725E